jgi:hypothetical protein
MNNSQAQSQSKAQAKSKSGYISILDQFHLDPKQFNHPDILQDVVIGLFMNALTLPDEVLNFRSDSFTVLNISNIVKISGQEATDYYEMIQDVLCGKDNTYFNYAGNIPAELFEHTKEVLFAVRIFDLSKHSKCLPLNPHIYVCIVAIVSARYHGNYGTYQDLLTYTEVEDIITQ